MDYAFWYPLVPIFAQWTDAAVLNAKTTELNALFNGPSSPFRDDIIYITVGQHDEGFLNINNKNCSAYRNILIMSAGGWGSVPLPLIKGFMHPSIENFPSWQRRTRKLVLSFAGKLHKGRDKMVRALDASTLPRGMWRTAEGDLRQASNDAVFGLTPRGHGRSSYRLYELLQIGIPTMYLYDDLPWLPYTKVQPSLWDAGGIAFAVPYNAVQRWACMACTLFEEGSRYKRHEGLSIWESSTSNIWNAASGDECMCSPDKWNAVIKPDANGTFTVPPTSAVAAMEERVAVAVRQFFTYDAVMDRIAAFVSDPVRAELTCVSRPAVACTGGMRRRAF